VKRVIQKDKDGCGMACVAMIVGRDYDYACKKLFRTKSGRGTYTVTSDLIQAIRRARPKLRCGSHLIRFKKGESPREVGSDAILKVRPPNGKISTWHWVVWDKRRGRIIDPLPKPYKRLRKYSYLPVYRD
jgi:hypothetical protein